jgi:protocatechuate 3,4-dioxygenase beta subunit
MCMMKTTASVALVTTLVTVASAAAQGTMQRQWEAAEKLKPARVSSAGRIAPATERGIPFTLHGVIVDPAGKPASGVEVLAYHTDTGGIYAAEGAADPWRLKGWAVTDAQGRFEFRTIRPGPYPGNQLPAHVHLIMSTSCCGKQIAEVMFDDDPIATKEVRARIKDVQWGAVARHADGSQEASYTFRLKPRGDF